MIKSILDNDMYKFSMGQAVCQLFPKAQARYSFVNRGGTEFPEGFADELRACVNFMESLSLDEDEEYYLRRSCPYLTPVYVDFFKGYRFDSSQVSIEQEGGELELHVTGPWYQAIYWEVPLMAMISELYFKLMNLLPMSRDALRLKNREKGVLLEKLGAKFADFGTRRRYSKDNHEWAVHDLELFATDSLVGTSNLQMAMNKNLKPIGTIAHEWIMFHAAKYGYRAANQVAMENWVNVYQGDLGIALPDTFTTDVFLQSFSLKYAKLFDGLRQDSGDPIEFTKKVFVHYGKLKVNPKSKTIVYSDSLNAEKVQEIEAWVGGRIQTAYGIGTNITNDVGVKPLNMVIKMTQCKPEGMGWINTVKLSDDKGKYTGNKREIDCCLKTLYREAGE